MALPITIPNTFAAATTSIPLANLDANFTTVVNAINGIGNGSEALVSVNITGGNAVFTVANATTSTITNMTSSNVVITGGTVSNTPIDFQDQLATRPTLKDYSINGEVLGLLNANTSLNFANANFFSATANANVTISFANASAANTMSGCVLALTNGGSQTLTWSNVAWSGNTAPSLTSNGLDILVFVTYDGGTTVNGMVASYNSYK
jgi:hypothetical protein